MSLKSLDVICLDSPERPPKRVRETRYSSPEDELPDLQTLLNYHREPKAPAGRPAIQDARSTKARTSDSIRASSPAIQGRPAPRAEKWQTAAKDSFIEIIESDDEPEVVPVFLRRTVSEIHSRPVHSNAQTQGPDGPGPASLASAAALARKTQSFPAGSDTIRPAKSVSSAVVCATESSRPSATARPSSGSATSSTKGQQALTSSRSHETSNAASVPRPKAAQQPATKPVAGASRPLMQTSTTTRPVPVSKTNFPLADARPPKRRSPSPGPPAADATAKATVVTLDELFDTAAFELDLSSEDEPEPLPLFNPKDPLANRKQGYLRPLAGRLPSNYIKRTDTTIADLITKGRPSLNSAASSAVDLSNTIAAQSSSPVPGFSGLKRADLVKPPRERIEPKTPSLYVAPEKTASKHVSAAAAVPRARPLPAAVSSAVNGIDQTKKALLARPPPNMGAREWADRVAELSDTSEDSITDEDTFRTCKYAADKRKKPKKSAVVSAAAKAALQTEKAAEKAVKLAEREAKKAERIRLQSVSSVNVLKTSKKDTSPEMIVRVCRSFEKEVFWTHMQALADTAGFACRVELMPIPGLIRFSRKTKAVYNAELGYWEPLPAEVIVEEPQLMVRLTAEAMLRMAEQTSALADHVASIRRVLPTARIIYLLEGVQNMLNKSRTARNREHALKVRQDMDPTGDYTAATGKSKQTAAVEIDEALLEDAMLDLQVLHRCLIVHAAKPVDTARELCTLAQDMSLIPYKSEAVKKAAFCLEPGQVKTGSDKRDTYEKMLASLLRVTPPMAEAIATRYATMSLLHAALSRDPMALDGLTIGNNLNGSFSTRKIGAITSKNVARVVTSKNPDADAS